MSGEQVVITIDDEANVKVGARKVRGADCVKLTKDFEDALGAVSDDVKTPDFYQQANAGTKAQQ